jgi:hypothetical protein
LVVVVVVVVLMQAQRVVRAAAGRAALLAEELSVGPGRPAKETLEAKAKAQQRRGKRRRVAAAVGQALLVVTLAPAQHPTTQRGMVATALPST